METIYLQIHHSSTPTGELLGMTCPYCAKKIGLRAKILPDSDTIALDYGKDKELSQAVNEEWKSLIDDIRRQKRVQ